MNRLDIKPLSVNRAWQGKRFKTSDYTHYEGILSLLLPKLDIPAGKLELTLLFGFSNKASDLDNPVKPFVDILQKKYGFNDNQIYKLNVEKVDVAKGKEFIAFSLKALSE